MGKENTVERRVQATIARLAGTKRPESTGDPPCTGPPEIDKEVEPNGTTKRRFQTRSTAATIWKAAATLMTSIGPECKQHKCP